MNGQKRTGLSLVEVLVVVAILATLVGLMLGAVQKARATAARAASMNNLRQIMLGVHNMAAAENGTLPALDYGMFDAWSLLDYIEGCEGYARHVKARGHSHIRVKCYVSPADPSLMVAKPGTFYPADDEEPRCSYAANATLFLGNVRLPQSVPDGTSTTIGFAEHYSMCRDTLFIYQMSTPGGQLRRPSFADRGQYPVQKPKEKAEWYGTDVAAVTDAGPPPVSRASTPGLTFQVRPRIEDCDPLIPQTAHESGMLTAWMDGSVRSIRPGVSEIAFWSAVTPAGGESVPLD